MNKADKYYIENLNKVISEGCMDENPRPKYKDGTPAYTKFITQVFEVYDISKGEFPIPTLRNTAIKTGIKEIFWIYQKQTNSLEAAHDLGIYWWDEWNVGDDTIGQRYGATVNRYKLMDNLLKNLETNPFGRRHLIELYQYSDINETAGLDPCAHLTEWSVRKIDGEYYLDLTLIMRSNDYLTAGYINKIQYVALQMMIVGHLNHKAGDINYKAGNFCQLTQNLHVYDRHFEAVEEILNKQTLDVQPTLILKENKNFYGYVIEDFEVVGVENITKLTNKLEIAI